MATRTGVLASDTAFAGTSVIFTVALNTTHIVKSILLQNQGLSQDIFMTLFHSLTGNNTRFFLAAALANNGLAAFNGFIAMSPNDQLTITFPNGSVSYWVSGAKLIGVA